MSGALRQHIHGFEEWKLLPLDQAAAERAAAAYLGDGRGGAEFIRAVAEARLGTMSACVGQLLATARYWRDHGNLPDGGEAAMAYEVKAFLRETNEDLHPALAVERRVRIAKRLGAFTAFARKQTLSVASGSDQALVASDLPTDPEPAEPTNDSGTRGIVVDREVQVARLSAGGIGTRIDLTLSASAGDDLLARVHVEAKRVDNRELMLTCSSPPLYSIAAMPWGTVELEPEVRDWLESLPMPQFATAAFYIDLVADRGPLLGEPYTRQLDGKLRSCGSIWRVGRCG